jgi:hypothetical protein
MIKAKKPKHQGRPKSDNGSAMFVLEKLPHPFRA